MKECDEISSSHYLSLSSLQPELQDSPLFSYISDLSPTKPLKEPAAQDFPGLDSPPLVFTTSQINSQYRPGFLQRSSCSQLSSSESPQQNIGTDNTSNKAICESEMPTNQLYCGMNPCTKKEQYDNKSPERNNDGSCSVTGCLDEYFKDIMVIDNRDSGNLESLSLRQYDNVHISSNKTVAYDGVDKSADVIMEVGGSPEMLDQIEEDCRAKHSSKQNTVETNDTSGGSDEPNNSTVDHAVDEQHNGHSETDNEGGGHMICGKSTAQLLQESNQAMQVPQEYNCVQTAGVVLNEQNMLLNDSKRQCSFRKRLQFEEEHPNNMENNPGMCKQSHIARNSKIPSSVVDVGVLELSTADIAPAFCTRQLEDHRPTPFTFINQNYGNSSLTVSRPSGIGLHLNSIVSAVPVQSSTGSITSAQVSYLNVRGKKSFCITGSTPTENARSSSSPSNMFENLSVIKESLVCGASSGNPSPGDKRKPIDEHPDHVKVFTRSSPRKKRKKSFVSDDGDGCKFCNCKKSKCLKLYCDCFAAGIYCADPCSCQGCFNKPEYEDTVLEIRQKIESKNPLAFAPKVVQRVTELAPVITQADINNSTPSSGRHKRGCSCKKSMCLKKYCECYQSSVGCSDGCRCEDCKNVFGKKEEYVFSKDNVVKEATNERSEMMFEEKLEDIANSNGFLQTEFRHHYSSTPMTPISQLSDCEKDALKSLSPERYLTSQQFDLTMFTPDVNPLDSIISSYNQDPIQETHKCIVDVISYDQELCFENSEEADDFSLHELGNRDSPSPQQKSSSVMNTTSVKVDDFSSHRLGIRDSLSALEKPSSVMNMTSLISSRTSDWTRSPQFSPGNGPFSLLSSLRWRGSPIIPTNLLGETKLSKVCDLDNKLYNEIEEDIPEILKDNLTPISAVKSSSPNKKRVSPPHNRLHELGSSSSPGLRSGRKFILKSVPFFPPLTPCIDVKGNTSHDNPDCNNN